MADHVAAIKEEQSQKPHGSRAHGWQISRPRLGGDHRVRALHQTTVQVLPEVTVTVTPELIVIGPALIAFLPEVIE